MKSCFYKILDNIDYTLIRRKNGGFLLAFIGWFNIGMLSNILGNLFIEGFMDWPWPKRILYTVVIAILTLPIYFSIEHFRKKKIDKVLESVRNEKKEFFQEEILNPEETIENIFDVEDNIRETKDGKLAYLASVNPSRMSLKQLQAAADYLKKYLPNQPVSEDDEPEEDELQEEPFVKGYVPKRKLWFSRKSNKTIL